MASDGVGVLFEVIKYTTNELHPSPLKLEILIRKLQQFSHDLKSGPGSQRLRFLPLTALLGRGLQTTRVQCRLVGLRSQQVIRKWGQGGNLVPKKPGLELSLYPTWLCGSDCVWASVSPSVQWEEQLGPHPGCYTVPPWRSQAGHSELLKGDRSREHRRRTDVTGPSHSPRAQKTFSLLESDKDTFKTSLWLSKSSSGPPQLSTIGDMSCRSGSMVSESKPPTTQTPSFPPSSPPMPAVTHPPVTSNGWRAGPPWTHGYLCHSLPTGWPRSP